MLSCAQTPGGWAAGATPGSRRGRAFLADCHGGGGAGGSASNSLIRFYPKGSLKALHLQKQSFTMSVQKTRPRRATMPTHPAGWNRSFILCFILENVLASMGSMAIAWPAFWDLM